MRIYRVVVVDDDHRDVLWSGDEPEVALRQADSLLTGTAAEMIEAGADPHVFSRDTAAAALARGESLCIVRLDGEQVIVETEDIDGLHT